MELFLDVSDARLELVPVINRGGFGFEDFVDVLCGVELGRLEFGYHLEVVGDDFAVVGDFACEALNFLVDDGGEFGF